MKVRGEKTRQRPVCVVCCRPVIFGMFGLDGRMFEHGNEPLPTVVGVVISGRPSVFTSLSGGNNTRRGGRPCPDAHTVCLHFKRLVPFDAPASSQVSFILGFGSGPKMAERRAQEEMGDNLRISNHLRQPQPPHKEQNWEPTRGINFYLHDFWVWNSRAVGFSMARPPPNRATVQCPLPILDNDSIK